MNVYSGFNSSYSDVSLFNLVYTSGKYSILTDTQNCQNEKIFILDNIPQMKFILQLITALLAMIFHNAIQVLLMGIIIMILPKI